MQARVVSFQKHKRLSIVQFLTANQNTFDYRSGSAAMKDDLIQVKEVSESGNVNNLFVFNLSDKYIFFMDGDILAGAKQNRVLNTSVLLAPNSKTTLPVSCVEQGRWSEASSDFRETDYIAPQKMRAKKAKAVKDNLETRNEMQAEQGQVWDDVEDYAACFSIKSPTKDFNAVYEQKKVDFDSFVNTFKLNSDANGLAVFVDQKILSTDVFNKTEIYQEYYPKILRSTAMEMSHLEDKENKLTEAEASFKTVSLFDSLEKIDYSKHKGVGIGEEKRFNTEELTGFELSFKNHLIHLTALNIEKDKKGDYGDFRRNRIY